MLIMANRHIPYQLTQDEFNFGVRATPLMWDDILLEPNFKMQITGPSMSGKSTFISKLLKHRALIFKQRFRRIIYCYPDDERTSMTHNYIHELQGSCGGLEVMQGLPSLEQLQTGVETLVSFIYNSL
jgi:septin family protein